MDSADSFASFPSGRQEGERSEAPILRLDDERVGPAALVVDDNVLMARAFSKILTEWGIRTTEASRNEEAYAFLTNSHSGEDEVHLITTDLIRVGQEEDGLDLVKWIRSHRCQPGESSVCTLRGMPIIVITGAGFDTGLVSELVDKKVLVLRKTDEIDELRRAVLSALTNYRDQLRQGLRKIGLVVVWESGRYEVRSLVGHTSAVSYDELGRTYSDLLLFQDRLDVAEWSLGEFEGLLNNPTATERDFQAFFRRHPEILLGDEYDDYWAEPILRSTDATMRPDFILKPRLQTAPWNWAVLDLKHPRAPLLTGHGRHPSLSHHVSRVITQLKNYADYFQDGRNAASIKLQFGDYLVRPRLITIIGRSPPGRMHELSIHLSRVGAVRVMTYDELLELRRVRVQWLRAIGR